MKQKIRVVVAVLILAMVWEASFAFLADARTKSLFMVRGMSKGFLVSPGDPDELLIWYLADGKSASAYFWSSEPIHLLFGAEGVPNIVLTTYYFPTGGGTVSLGSTSVNPFHRKVRLTSKNGVYLLSFAIRNPLFGDGFFADSLDLMAGGTATGLSVQIR